MRPCRRERSVLATHHSPFITRPYTRAGFSLVEILIAMFVFMFGILGVLSIFPVAMNSATRSMGQVRANVIAQSTLSQLQVDCRVPIVQDDSGTTAYTANTITSTAVSEDWTGYFVTVTQNDSPVRDQTRLIIATDTGTGVLTVCPDWNPQPAAGDEFIITRMGLPSLPRGTLASDAIDGGTNILTDVSWDDDQWNGYWIEILDGAAEGERRQIALTPGAGTIALNSELILTEAWEAPKVPVTGDSFAIVRDALGGTRVGYIREFTGEDSFYVGTANGSLVDELSWDVGWDEKIVTTGNPCPSDGTASTIEVTAGDWALAEPGMLMVVNEDPEDAAAGGQIRLITSMSGTNTVNVFPDWTDIPQSGDGYQIQRNLRHFLVITTGRSAGAIFPITGYDNTGTADEIECYGVAFRELGVKAAKPNASAPANLSNATGFMIVGSDTFLGSVAGTFITSAAGDNLPPATANSINNPTNYPVNDYGYALNTFGRPKASEPQCGADIYFEDTTDHEASEYSSACIFSEGDALTEGPVRVDIFVFRNFNNGGPLWKNRIPVGHVTGYIGRP